MNENAQIKDLEDKYVFWDIDGTLAPYRFNNHVADPNGTNNGMSLKEIEDGVFLTRKPSKRLISRYQTNWKDGGSHSICKFLQILWLCTNCYSLYEKYL